MKLEPSGSLEMEAIELYWKHQATINTPVRTFIQRAVDQAAAAKADLNLMQHTQHIHLFAAQDSRIAARQTGQKAA
jgi:hypothetical protein